MTSTVVLSVFAQLSTSRFLESVRLCYYSITRSYLPVRFEDSQLYFPEWLCSPDILPSVSVVPVDTIPEYCSKQPVTDPWLAHFR